MAAALGFGRGPRSLPVPYRAGARGMTDSGAPYVATAAGMGAPGSWGASSQRGASPPSASPQHRRGDPRALARNSSTGALRPGVPPVAQGSAGPPRRGDFGRLRSKTFQ